MENKTIPKELWYKWFKFYRTEIQFMSGMGHWNDKEILEKTRAACLQDINNQGL